jgi:hypothetical protein
VEDPQRVEHALYALVLEYLKPPGAQNRAHIAIAISIAFEALQDEHFKRSLPLLTDAVMCALFPQEQLPELSRSGHVISKFSVQQRPCPARALRSNEVLVLFVMDSNGPSLSDDFFEKAARIEVDKAPRDNLAHIWKVIRVPDPVFRMPGDSRGEPAMSPEILREMNLWGDAQPIRGDLAIMRGIQYAKPSHYVFVMAASDRSEIAPRRGGPDKPLDSGVRELGGKKYRVGQTLKPEELAELLQPAAGHAGPVTVHSEDRARGTRVTSRVTDWSDLTDGPCTNRADFEAQVADLQDKGYLAFEQTGSGRLKCRTPYVGLTPRFFQDYKRFQRFQEIPSQYFEPITSSTQTCFISHRWATLRHPDPEGVQFGLLKQLVEQRDVHSVWYDYSCLPQAPYSPVERELFRASIRDLNSLVLLTRFVGIITHDYISRAWCFYEWAISNMFRFQQITEIKARGVDTNYEPIVTRMIIEGQCPRLAVTQNEDMADIDELLVAGIYMFRTLALRTTMAALNRIGFNFGLGIASRFSRIIDFKRFWTTWQQLAESSEYGGIGIAHLLDEDRLLGVLGERHERQGAHATMLRNLGRLTARPLDMRIIDQEGQDYIVQVVRKLNAEGADRDSYPLLAMIEIVYSLAGTDKRLSNRLA